MRSAARTRRPPISLRTECVRVMLRILASLRAGWSSDRQDSRRAVAMRVKIILLSYQARCAARTRAAQEISRARDHCTHALARHRLALERGHRAVDLERKHHRAHISPQVRSRPSSVSYRPPTLRTWSAGVKAL